MQTKYKVKRLIFGSVLELDITFEEFQKLKTTKKILSAGLAIEEKYDVLLANYEEFEKEIMNITVESMVKPLMKYNDFRNHRAKLNQRLINLLTTSRLYIDSIARHTANILIDEDQVQSKIEMLFSKRYDNYLEYRFMEALRNHVQHFDFPIHNIRFGSRLANADNPETKFIFTVDLTSQKPFLAENKEFKKTVIEELGNNIDLKQATRKYIECLSEIHAEVRKLILDRLNEMRDLILNYQNEYNNKTGDNGVGLYAISQPEPHKVIEKVPMLLDWDDVRKELLQKNDAPIINLARRYASGESQNSK